MPDRRASFCCDMAGTDISAEKSVCVCVSRNNRVAVKKSVSGS
jgi:hypothetical protein